MKQLSREKAIEFYNSKLYEDWTPRQIAEFQMEQNLLCVPFDLFHESMEKALGRPVFTHEFGLNRDGLKKELYGEKEPPTLEEIINLIPKDKQIIFINL